MPKVALHGSWLSPITADSLASGEIGLGQIALDGEDVYWIEGRPAEAGRSVVVRCGRDGGTVDVTPAPHNARSRVHEYGGGAFAVDGGDVCFTSFADQQIYLQAGGAEPVRISGTDSRRRFADHAFDRARRRLISVCEEHAAGAAEARNSLVAVDLDGGGVQTLAAGHDFYSNPRLDPAGRQLAWLTWDHPNMPWHGTRLWVASVGADGRLGSPTCIAGGAHESIFQPEWSPEGALAFVSDRSGWWNLYLWRNGAAQALCSMQADFGAAQWVFGQSTYAFESPSRLVCSWVERGVWRLGALELNGTGRCVPYDLPYSEIAFVRTAPGRVVFRASGPRERVAVVEMNLQTSACRILRRSSAVDIDPGFVSEGEAIEFPTEDEERAHGFFYPPRNRDFSPPPGAKPPLLVMSHGGPTSAAGSGFNPRIQFWTSRGIAVLDVNYRGSTGYGRVYRELLAGGWGVADVDDCVDGALFLVASGRVDGERLAITGGSAGGYTTLCALTFRDVFKAGASYYGISDLEALAQDTHKFESRYEETLVGPYPAHRDLYRARSPIHFTEGLSCPVIFFQGLDDRVVPPAQAEKMVAALRAKGLSVEYLTFEGEGHGFRRAETIKRCLEAELAFYGRVFGF